MGSAIIELLKRYRVRVDRGLSPQELSEIEQRYQIVFPDDLRQLYAAGLPVGDRFLNWRDGSSANVERIRRSLNWPLEGMIFDVMHNSFWYPAWGDKPDLPEDRVRICEREYSKIPTLIPIYSHRYLPSNPPEAGNPVFSVYQTDIVYYGENLLEYFKVEFGDKPHGAIEFDQIKPIDFWSDVMG
ncbi:hypothetical protein C2I18_23410 [Paenibacillus sp. PK3_47]|uniref:SMI1/KNR4 family protein n=1 Tax=Paenibacillus sp. PK3_47 TaxID=2072642 RepID=UPI00201DE220|nr:SMI1/KNR4 family protein [Paenibacillus sp. PK3_47]UQZ36209.1 hypothetical protein C2I18_23410 [Paenibacillus sp. PK3_47]